ncbi:MAG: carboxypeptidase regulatory-like domain-containing protein [Candidatus Hydrogenedentes bacterium]|nr:carboxypeptidase regulatory-like domain-containing protein [Candidatus Hydrogenedentota bacterium]
MSKFWRQLTVAVCAVFVLTGCPALVLPALVGTLSGVVRDADTNAAIAGASVTTVPATSIATTAADGSFTFQNAPVGIYTVAVTAAGYVSQQIPGVSVTAGQTANAQVLLQKSAPTVGSVSGVVRKHSSPSDVPVAGATVALVEALTLDASSSKTPLETLAGTSPYTATTNAGGAFIINNVAPGSYFVHAMPGAADQDTVLPGGDSSRSSFEVGAGEAVAQDIVLSQRPSSAATYVGSGTCLLCHDGSVGPDVTGYRKTLHALVYRVPDQTSSIQDLSDFPNANAAHAYFKDGNDRDNTGAGDEYGLRINSAEFPAFSTSNAADVYDVWLGFEAGTGKYFMQFSDTTGAVMSEKYYVEFTFGGHGVYKERWITRVLANGAYDADAAGDDSSYYVLPVQYDENMQTGVELFHPYNYTNWGPPTSDGGPARAPAKNKSFDLNCAGCHFTGSSIFRDEAGLYHADALNTSDAAGILDYDGDGVKDEMVIGCESCHGPGSEHLSTGLPPKLVLSRYLSAERDAMLCGRCHTRGVGHGTFTGTTDHTEYPSKGTDTPEFPDPGIGYDEFVADYHTDGPGVYGDALGHSRQHHQQFVDLQKSKHYKNKYNLLGCSDCHELHNRELGPSLTMSSENNELCLNCHARWDFGLPEGYTFTAEAVAVSGHMSSNANMTVGYDPENTSAFGAATATGGVGQCATCHMPKTAASQSRFIHETVNAQGQPSGGRVRGDISSHVFDIITPAESQALFLTATSNKQMPNSCGSCHNDLVGGLDYAYKHGSAR